MGVEVNIKQVENRLKKIEAALGKKGRSAVARDAIRRLENDSRRAFAGKHDPLSRTPWAPRTTPAPWKTLHKSGRLEAAIYGEAKHGKYVSWIKGKVKDGNYPDGAPVARVANVHWWGAPGPRGRTGRRRHMNLPKRRFVGLYKASRRSIYAAAKSALSKALR